MFFEKNKNLMIATGAVALLWVILFYTLVAPSWEQAQAAQEAAQAKRKAWEASTNAEKERKEAKEDKRKNEFKIRKEAEADLTRASEVIDVKSKELRKIEFGTKDSLRSFSVASVGKNGDTKNLLNEKLKQTKDRANAIVRVKLEAEKLSVRFGEDTTSDALNLLRLAMVDRFLTACKDVKDPSTKDCKIEEIAGLDYYKPEIIQLPDAEKTKEKTSDEEEVAETKKPKAKGKDKDKEKDADKADEIERLVAIPMKVLVRAPERFMAQLLYELGQPTSGRPDGEDRRGYFCVKGFHVSVSNASASTGEKLLEMSVAVSALLRESEIKALGITLKSDGRGSSRREVESY
ncbi:MAG: hypothetical protein WCT04_00900 [Planctomycetota bacterium]